MKRIYKPLAALALSVSLLTGCGSEKAMLTSADYEWEDDTTQTSKGICVGDDSEAFLAAYGDYDIFTSRDGASYERLSAEEIPFDERITTILPTFVIDGIPTDFDSICKENEIEKSEVLSLISSSDYLSRHTVVYYYLSFVWEDGVIASIESNSMDYNEDASYYQELQ